MRIIKRHLKSYSSIVIVMLAVFLLSSCQPALGEPQRDTNVTAAPEPVFPATQDSTPPPYADVTPTPQPVPPATENSSPSPDTNATPTPQPVFPTAQDNNPPPKVTAEPEPFPTATPNVNPLLTPIEKLGVTGVAQDVGINTYRLTVTGLVEKPLSLAYQDILAYPSVTEIVVVECPGFFKDTAEWTGVPLSTILAEAGLTSGASRVTMSAIDGYRQTLTLEHINEYGVFLAYKVNGQTLPPAHGYPLRVVDKGSIGSKWVKWLESIKVE